jgi:uncharacterized protein YifE (UPF0438 family)
LLKIGKKRYSLTLLIEMSNKKEHLEYIKLKGEFNIKCSNAIFSNLEIILLRKYGYWFSALINGDLEPITTIQKEFILAFKEGKTPVTFQEKTWFKYIGRLKLEKESPEKFKLNYSLEEDDFFSREDYYKIHPEKK